MNRVKYTEWIDSYVDGELDAAGRQDFEAELSTNRDLALEYNLENDLRKILGQEDLLDFRAKCMSAQDEFKLSSRKLVKVVQFTRKYWYAAASVLLIAMITSGLFLFDSGSVSTKKLFNEFYKPEAIAPTRSPHVVEAIRFYNVKNFKAAEELFDKILVNEPLNIAVMYYSGLSNIEIKNYTKAIEKFESIILNGDNLYIENAEWYLGLSHLAAEQIDKAESIFKDIASTPGHYHANDAKSILEKIGKNKKNKKFLNNLFFLILPF